MRKDNQKTEKSSKSRRSARGIDYRVVEQSASALVDWLADLASEDIKGWREGERRVSEVRGYLHAKIRGEDGRAPSDDAVLLVSTQLIRAFANDPRVLAAVASIGRSIEPLIPTLLGNLASTTAANCAAHVPLVVPTARGAMPVLLRPPGVPLSVPVPLAQPPVRSRWIHLRRV
jgi:hypothetical protein